MTAIDCKVLCKAMSDIAQTPTTPTITKAEAPSFRNKKTTTLTRRCASLGTVSSVIPKPHQL